MSVLSIERVTIEPPASLPVSHLSVSSLNLYARCPLAWKRRYIDHLPDGVSGKMLLGSAAGAALCQHYGRQIETGEGISTEELLDEFSASLTGRTDREDDVDYGSDTPGRLKDTAAAALSLYHRVIAPTIDPVEVEREFELSWDGVDWTLTGFLDLETTDGAVGDYKMTGQKISDDKAAAEIQPTVYLAARRAEGYPAPEFRYHALIRTNQPKADIVPTLRTERQLDLLTTRVFAVARSIAWRWANDCWEGAGPDVAWLCRSCPASGCAWRLG